MIVTATELKVKSIAGFFRMFPRVRDIKKQLNAAEGIIFVKYQGFCTLTGWESKEDMRAFRNSGPHLEAIKNIRSIGGAKSITWETQKEPDWGEANQKLKDVSF